mmetsp:Transcript_108784/g.314113  ORF Transcript_108784/g.314113 Transcript_108784/m.314113 type:complete len:204 (-) Transcript_108784:605-1216(-)
MPVKREPCAPLLFRVAGGHPTKHGDVVDAALNDKALPHHRPEPVHPLQGVERQQHGDRGLQRADKGAGLLGEEGERPVHPLGQHLGGEGHERHVRRRDEHQRGDRQQICGQGRAPLQRDAQGGEPTVRRHPGVLKCHLARFLQQVADVEPVWPRCATWEPLLRRAVQALTERLIGALRVEEVLRRLHGVGDIGLHGVARVLVV